MGRSKTLIGWLACVVCLAGLIWSEQATSARPAVSRDATGRAANSATGRPAPEDDKDYEQWREAKDAATPVSQIHAPEGFKVELLRSAPEEEGSWISLAFDPKGRLYVGIEGQWKRKGQGILRMTFTENAAEPVTVELVEDSLVESRGLLWAHDSLYAQSNVSTDQRPSGLYRLRDTDGDGRFDEVKLLRHAPGGGHGLNDLTLGPDGYLYLIQGDQSSLPPDWDPAQTLVRNVGRDQLLDEKGQPNSFGPQRPMEGRLIRTDADGQLWQVIASGMRNPMGIDFNPDGEAFTFEADMEWDVGLPWYRPTHVIHLLSGTDYGWRQGTDPWPLDSPDLPPTSAIVGLGSPTAVKFGTASNFPPNYRKALFIQDWAYGRILAVHLMPRGAGYDARWETFIDGRPLNVTDMEFGPDGAMYFVTGGRGTQSGLYRVRYVGPEVQAAAISEEERQQDEQATAARALRRRLESFHSVADPAAIDEIWPHLGSTDPWIRHAGRIALEHQPVERWQSRALSESETPAALTACLALTRAASPSAQSAILGRLLQFDLPTLPEDQQKLALRTYELCFHRMGRPNAQQTEVIRKTLDRVYPASSVAINRSLSQLLVFLGAHEIVAQTLPLITAAETQEQKSYFVNVLRPVRDGWSPQHVSLYFQALGQLRSMPGGRQYEAHVESLINDSLAKLPKDQQLVASQVLTSASATTAPDDWVPRPRRLVRAWTMADLDEELTRTRGEPSPMRGKQLFREIGCMQCHRMGGEGGALGPDLTQVGRRFGRRDLLRSIVEPSTVIGEKYRIAIIATSDDKQHVGYVAREDDQTITLTSDPLATEQVVIEKSTVRRRQWSPISSMPAGLANTLTANEILDLLAYLESDGTSAGAGLTR